MIFFVEPHSSTAGTGTYRAPFAAGGPVAIDERLCERLLEVALSKGGDYADLFFEYRAGGGLSFEEGILRSASRGVSLGLGVRVQKGDATGYAYVEDLEFDAMKRAAEMGAFLEACWNALAPGRMDSPELAAQFREVGIGQCIASTDYFRPYSPNPAELFRMYLGMLHEGGLSRGEINQVAARNPARVMGLE